MIRPVESSRVRAWLELFRLPNLLTVPGDAMAGHLLVAGSAAGLVAHGLPAAGAGLLFYMGGLVLNDVADVETDRAERPARPIPSNRVSIEAARTVATLLLLGGEVLCVLMGALSAWIGLGLVSSILLYNLRTKEVPGLGPVNMGLCRGFNLLLGASSAAQSEFLTPQVMTAFVLWTAFIAAVTHLARKEMRPGVMGPARWLPLLVLVVGAVALISVSAAESVEEKIRMGGCLLLAGGLSTFAAVQLGRVEIHRRRSAPAQAKPNAIGLLVSGIIFVQAAGVVGSGAAPWSFLVGLLLLLLWPLNRWLTKVFYAS